MKKYLLSFIFLFFIGAAWTTNATVNILFFTATWCGPCGTMEKNLTQLKDDSSGEITLQTINVDDDEDQAQKNNITSIPVTIVAGKRFVGAVPLSHIGRAISQASVKG